MKSIKIKLMNFSTKGEPDVLEKEVMFEYTDDTQFSSIMDYFQIDDVLSDGIMSITRKNKSPTDRELCFNYIVRNGIVEWLFPLEECTINEYLLTYKLDEIILYLPLEVGGIEFLDLDWICIMEALKQGLIFLETVIMLRDVHCIVKDIKNKFLKHKNGCVPIKTVESFIKSRDYWTLDDLKFKMNLKDNEPLIQLLLELCGYIYSREDNIYFYNKSLAKKNETKLNELINKKLENRS